LRGQQKEKKRFAIPTMVENRPTTTEKGGGYA
jgi:hypothetical protein